MINNNNNNIISIAHPSVIKKQPQRRFSRLVENKTQINKYIKQVDELNLTHGDSG